MRRREFTLIRSSKSRCTWCICKFTHIWSLPFSLYTSKLDWRSNYKMHLLCWSL